MGEHDRYADELEASNRLRDRPSVEQLYTESCRTVRTVYLQFSELKQTVLGLIQQSQGVERSYLTPTEDETLRRLAVSYWHLRLALLEMVYELRDRGDSHPSDRRHLFLPGFAGALVLLDAARFLRDHFHHWKTIRRKLNEPDPSFGLPAGLYDSTQGSWTLPSHIWQLFDAAKYFQHEEAHYRQQEVDSDACAMLQVIDALSNRLKIGWSDYAKLRLRFRFRQFWSMLKRDLYHSAMFQIQKGMGILAADRYLKQGHQPALPTAIRSQLENVLQPGDVLLVRKEFALTNYFLPGFWPHTALYLGDPESLVRLGLDRDAEVLPRWQQLLCCDHETRGRVMEAMKDGVHIRALDSPFRSDSILVLRPNLSSASIAKALARAFLHEGKDYDFSFDFTRSDRLVCTEVIYRAYDGIDGINFSLSPRAGRLTLAAADIVSMGLHEMPFHIFATYIPGSSSQLLFGQQARSAVEQVANPSLG